MTIRRALTELVNEGLLERRHGSGTYVAKPKVTYEAGELVNYTQAMQQRNIATSSQLLEFSEIAASRRLAELLKIEIGNPIHRIDILRLANRVPVILERVFFPCARFSNLQEWDLEKSSMYDLITTVYKVEIGQISQTVEAVAAAASRGKFSPPDAFPAHLPKGYNFAGRIFAGFPAERLCKDSLHRSV
jgi:GntR family transcriptional regulator